MKHWQTLQTIHDFLRSCEEEVRQYKLGLSKDEKETLAAHIVSLTANDHFEEWAEQYPYLYEIETLSSDLEWSNAEYDVDLDWRKLISYIEELRQYINALGSPEG